MNVDHVDGAPDPRSELSSLIESGLGHAVDDSVLEALMVMQSSLQERQRELAMLLMSGRISREQYLSELDEALKQAAEAGESSLGAGDFHKVFGNFQVQNIIDITQFGTGHAGAR